MAINTGSTSLGSSGLNALMTVLSDQFVQAGRCWNPALKFCMDVSPEVGEKGQAVNVNIAPDVQSKLLTDGNAKENDDSVGSSVTVTLDKHRYCSFSMTQMAGAVTQNSVAMMEIQSRIIGLLNGIEEDVLSLATSSFTENDAVNAYASALAEDDIIGCVVALANQKAPGPYVGLVQAGSANAWGALAKLADFSDANVRGAPGAAYSANWGAGQLWHNTVWYPTQALPKSSTNVDNLVMHRSGIAIAMRQFAKPIGGGAVTQEVFDPASGIMFQIVYQWDGDRLAEEVVVHALYGYAVGKEKWAVQLKS